MEKLQLNETGMFGELRNRPNPDGFVLRTKIDIRTLLTEAVTVMQADAHNEESLQEEIEKMPVMACLPSVEDNDFPFVAESISYDEYKRLIEKARS